MSNAVLPKLSRKHLLQGLLGITVAGALLSLCIFRTEPGELVRSLGSLTVAALIPALLCEAAVQLSKALKWQAVLSRVQPVRYTSTLAAVVVGAASTHLVPLRLDEVLRSAVLARREGLAPGTVLGTVAIDRILELFVLGLIFASATLFIDLPSWMTTGAWVLWALLLLSVIGVVLILRGEDNLSRRLSSSSLAAGPWLGRAVHSLGRGLRSMPRGRGLLRFIVGTTGEWLATIVLYIWMLHAFGVDADDVVPLIMTIGNSVAYMIPNVPGALGMYEGVQAGILESLAGLEPAPAMAVALAAHAVLMVPVTLAGLLVGAFEFRRIRVGPTNPAEVD